jgi:FlaA1/EpsC-like NDP-sugar epimerase
VALAHLVILCMNVFPACVCLSADKTLYPINAMRISKAMMEQIKVTNSCNVHERSQLSAIRATATS